MSGPKVVRVVSREELERACERQLAVVRSAASDLLRTLQRHDLLTTEIESDIAGRVRSLSELTAAGNFATVQRQAPDLILFLRRETQRQQEIAIQRAESVRAQRQKVLDAARSVADALAKRAMPLPDELNDVLRLGSRLQSGELAAARKSVDAAFRVLIDADNSEPSASSELARRLGRGAEHSSLSDWLAKDTLPSAQADRLPKLLAEVEVLGDTEMLDRVSVQSEQIRQEPNLDRRRLLTDSLLLEVSSLVSELKRAHAIRDRLAEVDAELAVIPGDEASALRTRIATLQGGTEGADELVATSRELIDGTSRAAAAASRRRAVLAGLAGLGYEVKEGMETVWAEGGRLVVAKPGATDYGVELAGPNDASRLQMRVVAAELPAAPRTRDRDVEQENIWCHEVGELLASAAIAGTEIVIERALPVGAQALQTTKAIGMSGDQAIADRRTVKPRFLS